MAEINHRAGIAGPVTEVYKALTTDDGLSNWWTRDTSGSGDVGAVINFRFNGEGPDFEIVELQENVLIRWKHKGVMPQAWMGTEVSFHLSTDSGETIVRFRHSGWEAATDFMAHCSTKWAVFLLSLKDFIETGSGRPFPDDVHIDHSE